MNFVFFLADVAQKPKTDYSKIANSFDVLSIIFFILAAICFSVAIFAFIKFKVPKLIGDLNGSTARRAVSKMRANNEKSGNKSFRPTPVAKERGKTTDKINPSGKIKKDKTKNGNKDPNATDILSNTQLNGEATELLNENASDNVTSLLNNNASNNSTTVLNSANNATTILNEADNTTTILNNNDADNATSLLSQNVETELLSNNQNANHQSDGTTLLTEQSVQTATKIPSSLGMKHIQNIVLIHTEETI